MKKELEEYKAERAKVVIDCMSSLTLVDILPPKASQLSYQNSVIKDKNGVPSFSPSALMPKIRPKRKPFPRHNKRPVQSKEKKHPSSKPVGSCKKSIIGPQPHTPPLLRSPDRSSIGSYNGDWPLQNSMTNFFPLWENDAEI